MTVFRGQRSNVGDGHRTPGVMPVARSRHKQGTKRQLKDEIPCLKYVPVLYRSRVCQKAHTDSDTHSPFTQALSHTKAGPAPHGGAR